MMSSRQKKYYEKNKEAILAKKKQFRKENPGIARDRDRKYKGTQKASPMLLRHIREALNAKDVGRCTTSNPTESIQSDV